MIVIHQKVVDRRAKYYIGSSVIWKEQDGGNHVKQDSNKLARMEYYENVAAKCGQFLCYRGIIIEYLYK